MPSANESAGSAEGFGLPADRHLSPAPSGCDEPDHDHRDERQPDPSAAALRTRDRGRVQEA